MTTHDQVEAASNAYHRSIIAVCEEWHENGGVIAAETVDAMERAGDAYRAVLAGWARGERMETAR